MARIIKLLVSSLPLLTLALASPVAKHHKGRKGGPPKYGGKPSKESYWPGWEGISRMIVFGDSYATHYHVPDNQ